MIMKKLTVCLLLYVPLMLNGAPPQKSDSLDSFYSFLDGDEGTPKPQGWLTHYLEMSQHGLDQEGREQFSDFLHRVRQLDGTVAREMDSWLSDPNNDYVDKRNAYLERAFHTITSGAPGHIPAKLHFVWRDNPLPDRYVLELVSLASEILNHGESRLPWSLHLWVNDARLLRRWKESCHPTIFKEIDVYVNHPDQHDLRGYLTDLWDKNWWNKAEYGVKTLCEHVLSCVQGKEDLFEVTAFRGT